MNLIRSFQKFPITLFRAKTKAYASVRKNERPTIGLGDTCYPRTDERWTNPPSAPGFGISILSNGEKIRALRNIHHIYVFKEGMVIPEDLILYQTSFDHFSLELQKTMELEGILRNASFNA